MAEQESGSRTRYQIVKRLDAGGMAEIFLGKAVSLEGIERNVAIKRVLPHLASNTEFITMFLDEARLSMGLTNANICQVFDVGEAGDTYFIVMEFINGQNVRRLFQRATERNFRIPLEISCYIIMETMKGLQYAHTKRNDAGEHLKIVHRDLSPPNIMVSKEGEVKVMDFGLAKAASQVAVTDPGVVKGKFSYLAPEAALGHDNLDHRVDIFAAGICLWELLANRRLFLGKSDMETVELVRACHIPPITSLNPQCTPEFEAILNKSLAKDPEKRFMTSREMGDAIANYLFQNGLKVTGYDLAGMIQRLFSPDTEKSMESPEERIASLIQDEILTLSMMGALNKGGVIDSSRPIDANTVDRSPRSRLDLGLYFEQIDMEQLLRSAREGGSTTDADDDKKKGWGFWKR